MQQANFALATQFNLPTFGNRIPDGIHFQHLLQLPLAAPSTSAGARPENAVSHPAGVPSRQHPGIVPEQGFQDDSDLGRDWETSEYEDEFVELHERRIRTGLASRTVAMFFPTEAPRLSPPSPTGIDLSLGGTEFSDGSDLSGGFDSSDGVGSFDAYPAFTQASQQEQHSSATLCFPGDAQQIAAATAAALGFSVDNHILGGTNMNGPIPDGFGHFSDSSAALTPSTASNPSTASTLFSGTNRADIQHLHQASPQPALQVLHLPAAAPFEGDVILGRFDPLLGIGAASVQPAHQGQQILTTPLADASAVPALWLDAAVRAASGLPWPAGQAIRGFVGLLPSQGNGNPQPHEGEDVGSAGLGNPLSDYEDFTAQSMMPLGVLNFMSPDLAAQLSGGAEPDYLDDFFLFLPAQVDGEDDLPARLPKQRKAAQ
ncbi:hypothetical protein DFJ74DRAFT_84802 [Hyaloraphidium curvatum]|nr:hypothetical protein DFJ74DRAFT_84802 [Hyaloraphidium curvatum]